MRLSTGEDFSKLDGNVRFLPGDPPARWGTTKVKTVFDHEEDVPIIGTLSYSGAVDDDFDRYAAGYEAEVWIAPSQFDELSKAASQGKLPTVISLEVAGAGIQYGAEPDGSGKDWDNKEHPQLAVVGFSLGVLLAAKLVERDEEPEPGVPTLDDLPPTRAQVTELLNKVSSLPMKIFWIGAFLVLVLVFFRR